MAQDSNKVLNQILHVVTQIRDQGGKKPSDKSDAGSGPISGMFGKKSNNKDLKDGAETMKSIFNSIIGFNKVKINTRKIDATSKALKGLFDTVIHIGRSRKVVINAMKMFDMLAKSLTTMTVFAKAMTTLLMSVGFSIVAIAGGIALAGVLLGTSGKPLATMMVIVGVLTGIAGALALLGKAAPWVKPGTRTAKGMGLAMKALGVGLVVFVGSLLLISQMLKLSPGPAGMAKGMLMIVGVIAGMGLVFAGIGMFAGPIGKGTKVAKKMGIGMAALALGAFALVTVARMMTGAFSSGDALKKDGTTKKGKFGQMMANVGPGLGVMGIVLVSAGLLFAGLGALSAVIIPGVITGVMMAGGMILFAIATKKVLDVSKQLGEPGEAQATITGMVSGVLLGLINGVSLALNPGGAKGVKGFAANIKNTAVLMQGIGLLMGVSVALSMFAYALTAFANLDNMRVIESYDEKTGKPKFGPTVNIEGVGDTIRATLVNFLVGSDGNSGLIGATTGLTKRHSAAIGRMARSLTGRRGMLTAIIQFADVLKTFAQFGPEGKIGYVEMLPDGVDEDGNAKFKQIPHSVPILSVTKVITDSIGQFSTGIAEGVEGISRRDRNKILNMSKALIGKKFGEKSRRADKPGLLEPINAFSETLMIYAKFGSKGGIPILDEEGKATGGFIPIKDIVGNIVTAISSFSSELSTQLKDPGESVGQAQKKMEGYMGLLEQLGTLSTASEGLDQTAVSIMSLATSMGALSESINKADLDKLAIFAEINKDTNSFGGFLNKSAENSAERREGRVAKSVAKAEAKASPGIDTSQLANAIGAAVAGAFKNGQFTFQFQDQDRGVLTYK